MVEAGAALLALSASGSAVGVFSAAAGVVSAGGAAEEESSSAAAVDDESGAAVVSALWPEEDPVELAEVAVEEALLLVEVCGVHPRPARKASPPLILLSFSRIGSFGS